MPVISKQNLFLIPSYKMLPPIYIISSDHLTIVSGGGFDCQTSLWETFGGCATLIFFPPVLLCMRSCFWGIRFLCIYYSKPAWIFSPLLQDWVWCYNFCVILYFFLLRHTYKAIGPLLVCLPLAHHIFGIILRCKSKKFPPVVWGGAIIRSYVTSLKVDFIL